MSLVHEALQKAEREKQRKLGTTPSAPTAYAAPPPVAASPVHAPYIAAPVASAAYEAIVHRPDARVEKPTETKNFLLPALISCVAIVAIIATVFLVSNATSVWRQPKENAPVAATTASVPVAKPAVPVESPPTVSPPAESAAPVSVAATAADESKYKLSGIMKDPDGKPVAVLNGRITYEGYYVDGATVKKIDEDRVTLDVKGQEVVLRLH